MENILNKSYFTIDFYKQVVKNTQVPSQLVWDGKKILL